MLVGEGLSKNFLGLGLEGRKVLRTCGIKCNFSLAK
jgi:hypothetical protein